MKHFNILCRLTAAAAAIFLASSVQSCSDDLLDQLQPDRFNPENLLVDKAGFETIIYSLHRYAREEIIKDQVGDMATGTDIAASGVSDGRFFNDYSLLTPETNAPVRHYWKWAYVDIIANANMVIDRAENENIKWTEEEKNAIVGEAKFFRAYAYNVLANLWGGVPIVEHEQKKPVFDFKRNTRTEVLDFARKDLEFAAEWLPCVDENPEHEGRIFKAAACHLLAEVYISLGVATGNEAYFKKAVSYASMVIDGECGEYHLMKERFGDLSREGDYYSDLFWTGQQSRASGNREAIWVVQFEYGFGAAGGEGRNEDLRWWGPKLNNITFPDGKQVVFGDSLFNMHGGVRPTNHVLYEVWDDPHDMRISKYNFRTRFYVNNPDSKYHLQEIRKYQKPDGLWYFLDADNNKTDALVDTVRAFFPYFRKIEGTRWTGVNNDRTYNDKYRMRLSETYLLRAEAYYHLGKLNYAAKDINEVRERAQTYPISASQVTLDFILDERIRELIVEEQRRRTLARLGVFFERTERYNTRVENLQPYNQWWPIPQNVIDANYGAKIEQNPGYAGGPAYDSSNICLQ
ncbi:MAG: RagB/SusD family nutrient uptake outer membrane protein [Bacteroidales bacterium]|nr:RagB/SusD family nutrient uptake outer membrane protein [Candidatus Cryptobacteroides aphodequi]